MRRLGAFAWLSLATNPKGCYRAKDGAARMKTEVQVVERPNGVEVTRWLRFEKLCTITKKAHRVHVRFEDWKRINIDGELIQNILPHYTECDREFLISGITPAEWDAMEAAMPEEMK